MLFLLVYALSRCVIAIRTTGQIVILFYLFFVPPSEIVSFLTLVKVSKTFTSFTYNVHTSYCNSAFISVSFAIVFLSSVEALAKCVIAIRASDSLSDTLLAYPADAAVVDDSCKS